MRRSRTLVSLIALSFVLSACGSSSSDSGSDSNAQGQEGALAPYDAAKAGGTLTLVAKGAAGTLELHTSILAAIPGNLRWSTCI